MPLSHSRLTKAKKREDVLPVFKCSKLKKKIKKAHQLASLCPVEDTPTSQGALLSSFKYTIYTCDSCTVEGGEEATIMTACCPERGNHRGVCWCVLDMLCVVKSGASQAGVGGMREV